MLVVSDHLARQLFQFYNRPRKEGRLAFLDKRIAEPGERACLFLASAFGFLVAAVGLAMVVSSWG